MDKQSISKKIILGLKTLLFFTIGTVFIFTVLYFGTKDQVTKPEFCKICHMMKPEFYSWQASSHGQIQCVACHKLDDYQTYLSSGKRVLLAVTGTYTDPIRTLKPIDDKVCERCHNMTKRQVSPNGDVIIPHNVHKGEKVTCVRCHKTVTHGDISERKVTYRTDYSDWNSEFGKTVMTTDFYRPRMDTCMRCHKVRNGPLDCRACHRTRMLPVSHKKPEFVKKAADHGKLALDKLQYCDSCHGYMSEAQFTNFQEKSALDKFFTGKPTETKKDQFTIDNEYRTTTSYAKTNEYCKKCHRVKPASHNETFINSHGARAKINKKTCFVCHDDKTSNNSNVKVGCQNCHPSVHALDFAWKKYHPIPLAPNQKVEPRCYQCHPTSICAKCHKGSDKGVVLPVKRENDNKNIGVPAN